MGSVCVVSALDSFTAQFGGLDEVLLLSFLISVGIAVVVSPLYLLIYQALVAMFMMVKDPGAQDSKPHAIPMANSLFTAVKDDQLQTVMTARYKQFNRTLIISLGFYVLSMTVLMVLYASGDYIPGDAIDAELLMEKLALFGFVVLMVLPMLNQLFVPGWFRRVSGYILVIGALGVGTVTMLEESTDDIGVLLDNLSLLFFVGVAVVGFAIRKVRNVAAQISLAVQVIFVSSFLYYLLLGIGESCLLPLMFGEIEQDVLDILVLLAVLIYFPLMYLVWRILLYFVGKMVDAYDKGIYSDFQLQTILWMFLITLFFGAMLSADQSDDNVFDQRSALAFLVLALSIGLYLVLNYRTSAWKPAKSLLYLRVFATEKYSEYLFDHISKYWRHIGPVNMIGGPDFALMNLDIKEAYYLIFKRSLLHELFIDEPATLQERLATMNRLPSSDKQYTVNEFFCTDNMWQETVTELAAQADRVLLDLRGFSQERKGAEFELHLLGEMGLLEHTTFVVDSHTDWDAIRAALEDLPDVNMPEHRVLEMKGAKIDARVVEYLAR